METASLVTWLGVGVAIIAVLLWATRRYAEKHPPDEPMRVTDPVCGMSFDADKAVAKIARAGKTYHFCSEACHKRFAADPGRYAGRGPSQEQGAHDH
jgi:YHS domain-containing protein